VAVDREETLKKAEKLLKQGKVAAAIEEFVRLVEDKPSDWNSVNALGDLYLKAGQSERAAEQFTRAADHLYGEGFFPRASALYKKVLKVRSGDDHAIWQLADIAARNRLSHDARSYYTRLINDRRAAGNEAGVIDCLIRLGQLEDASVEARRIAADALVERGERAQAARLVLAIAESQARDGRQDEALQALNEAAVLNPLDQEIKEKLAAASPVVETVAEPAPVADVENIPESVAIDDVPVAADAGPIVLEPAPAEPATIRAELSSAPDAAAEALPLESFFEELRGRVARDQEVRAREQLDRGFQHLQENRPAEAVTELEEASRNPSLRFEAASQLARIFLGRGDLKTSIDWMERALEAPAPNPQERLGLMYDLADTFVKQGDTARALAIFMEVESEASGYEDVRDRIAQLSQAEIGRS
jgi:tetratricopeptide (TPR) repeat protein